jgi:hypothetical protein
VAATDDEHPARRLAFGKQDRSGRIGSGESLSLQGLGYDWRKIAKSLVYWRQLLDVI